MSEIATQPENILQRNGSQATEPFRFFSEQRLVQLTGLKARTLKQLLVYLHRVPGSSIFYHTHQAFLEHHFEKPVAYNDFAVWVADALQDDALGEKLGVFDLRDFTTVRQIREALISTIEKHLAGAAGRQIRRAPPGEEFHFCRSKGFVMPNGIVAHTVPEFFDRIANVTNMSLYFHFLESRLRLGRPTNDFSYWLAAQGETALADAIDALNPYTRTLDELKADIVALGHQR